MDRRQIDQAHGQATQLLDKLSAFGEQLITEVRTTDGDNPPGSGRLHKAIGEMRGWFVEMLARVRKG